MIHRPGEIYIYQGAMSVLLGGVVEKVTGKNLRQYTESTLFEPLGISNYDWFSHDVTGDYLGSSGLYLRTRDLAKLGQLYLNRGIWNGRRIFSEQWADESLIPSGRFWQNRAIEYDNNWWFPFITQYDQRLQVAAMRGSGGQELIIMPDHKLIVAMTSGAYKEQDEDYPFELLVDYVLPSLGMQNAKYQPVF